MWFEISHDRIDVVQMPQSVMWFHYFVWLIAEGHKHVVNALEKSWLAFGGWIVLSCEDSKCSAFDLACF